MNKFNGMVRDTLPINNPEGTWHWGKNMLLNKGHKSISNEYGLKYEYTVPGTVLGIIATNFEIVYLSKNIDGTDEIGRVSLETSSPTYETIVKSSLFNFQLNCPIEGIFIYNFKKELVVTWSNGIKENSNRPFVVNIDNIPLNLNPDKTLVNDDEFTKLFMQPDKLEGDLEVELVDGRDLGFEVVYITYQYVLDDATDDFLPPFLTGEVIYLRRNEYLNNEAGYFIPTLKFTNLDPKYTKLKLNIVTKKRDGTLEGHISDSILYENGSLEYILNSFEVFTKTDAAQILINSVYFEKVETLTKQRNELHLGNVVVGSSLNFQKYANLLKIAPTKESYSLFDFTLKASLLPDEVYSFYIHLQLLNGEYTDGYHIPGDEVDLASDLLPLTDTQKNEYNLHWVDDINGLKQFHIFNKGVIDDTIPSNNKFGHWSNIETYPNTEEFNSTVDYDNQSLAGNDLRNTPIRYHRVPSLNECHDFTYGDISNNPDGIPGFTPPDDVRLGEINGERSIIGLKVLNFHTIVPQEIKDKIQGYRISFVKRTQINNFVLGNWVLAKFLQTGITIGSNPSIRFNTTIVHNTRLPFMTSNPNHYNFKVSRIFSQEVLKNLPQLAPTYVRANYAFHHRYAVGKYANINDNLKYAKAANSVRYLPENNSVEGTQYRLESVNIEFENDLADLNLNTHKIDMASAINVTAFSYKLDLYQGFKSTNLVLMGRTSILDGEVAIKGGDTFVTGFSYLSFYRTFLHDGVYQQQFSLINPTGLYTPYHNMKVVYSSGEVGFTQSMEFYPNPDERLENLANTKTITGNQVPMINDLGTLLTNEIEDVETNIFPYRIHRSINLGTEVLSTSALRTFLQNAYYDMPNDKGEIIALRGASKKLFIQLKYALFVATIKEKLETSNVTAYLGQTDIFEYLPDEVIADDKGYIGSTSKFACIIVQDMYITIDQANGKIFLIQNGVKEISKHGMINWFRNNSDIGFDFFSSDILNPKKRVDNPFLSLGHLIAYDIEFNRLLFIKKDYNFIGEESEVTFDGEFYRLEDTNELIEFSNTTYFENLSRTFSFYLEKLSWGFEHDYQPNGLYNSHSNLFSFVNTLNSPVDVYKHNNKFTKGEYYGQKFESYVDLIFNKNLSITKLYKTISWITTTINPINGAEQFKTISKVMLYNENQCSGIIALNSDNIKGRNNEWFFNDFRDLIITPTNPIIDDKGDLYINNINQFKIWFEKSNFISKFIVVRLIIDNQENDDVYIHQVNAKSLINK